MLRVQITFICLVFTGSCAGPTTSFGPLNDIMPLEKDDSSSSLTLPKMESAGLNSSEVPIKISFHPMYQDMNQRRNFTVEITSAEVISGDHKLFVFYNGLDVSSQFIQNSSVERDEKGIKYTFNDLKLPAKHRHGIEVYFQRSLRHQLLIADYQPPICPVEEVWKISKTSPYSPPTNILDSIEKISIENNLNPSLVTGLIAQESSFNPDSVSWAKAIGLTQVTSIFLRPVT